MKEGTDRVAAAGASAVLASFDRYRHDFAAITARAPGRFAAREWRSALDDAVHRLDVYRRAVDALEGEIFRLLGDGARERSAWKAMRLHYAGSIESRDDRELAETFFNSITRRVFATVGVDDEIEFVSADTVVRPATGEHIALDGGTPHEVIGAVLDFGSPGIAWENRTRDIGLAAARVAARIGGGAISAVEMALHPFFRGMGAYLVGLLHTADSAVPMVLALRNGPAGVRIEAVLLEERDVSILFSYTRSYFQVEVDHPAALVGFLRRIVPRKRIAELYIALGFDKHGKTELYREIIEHLEGTEERFELTAGTPGMVMAAFGLPSQDLVFKVIRDRFPLPKQTTRRAVMERYRLVFRHDRAGRLIDAWEFEHLEFDRGRFSGEVLEDLASTSGRTVQIGADRVVVHHAYIERRVTPLDVFIRTRPFAEASAALADMGTAVKDLARSGIFPGDMLLKNFGVTRSGRVVFYDYDELTLLGGVRFRHLPEPVHPEDEMRAEPIWGVGDRDVFPEEFRHFLGLPAPLREQFVDAHADLFDPEMWRDIQHRLGEGEAMEIPPYEGARRLGE